MSLTYFNLNQRKAFQPSSAASPFKHRIGGDSSEVMLQRDALTVPFDLLATLDLSDPALDRTRLPNVVKLPLVYGIDYVGYHGEQRYTVQEDGKVEIANTNSLKSDGDHTPPWKPTSEFVSLVDCDFDLSRAEDALTMLQVFGLKDLSEDELNRALEIAYSDEYNLDVMEDWIVYRESTRQEYLEFWGSCPFWQPGGVSTSCTKPGCKGDDAQVLATIDIGRLLVIFRYCPDCQSTLAHNQA